MSEKQTKPLKVIKNVTTAVWFSGFILFLSSFFVSGIKQSYFFSISASIMVSAILTLGFCIFINIMEEVSHRSRTIHRVNKAHASFAFKKSPQLY